MRTGPEPATAHPRHGMSPRRILALVVAALTLIFIVQNRDTVQIQFFTLTVTAALWLILVIMVVVGVLIGVLVSRRS
jgi:putative membrane protein